MHSSPCTARAARTGALLQMATHRLMRMTRQGCYVLSTLLQYLMLFNAPRISLEHLVWRSCLLPTSTR